MILVVGNKTYSSWSLRTWVLMTHFEIPFEEVAIRFDMPDTEKNIRKYSPTGLVPLLIDGDLKVWDTLAIAEYLNEKFPQKQMWPQDKQKRAFARSISSEMHSGFQQMRNIMSHHLKLTFNDYDWSGAVKDVERVKSIWNECLDHSGGPFLFGAFTIADAMFAPVVNRFITYSVPVDGKIAAYVKSVRELPAHRKWIEEAMKEDFIAPSHEADIMSRYKK